MAAPAELVEKCCSTLPAARVDALYSFLAVARDRSISRASRSLFITQSGLTRRIQALERELGHKLIVTTSRELDLTAAGHALVPHAIATVHAMSDAMKGMRAATETRPPHR